MSGVITINLCSNESEATRLKSLKNVNDLH